MHQQSRIAEYADANINCKLLDLDYIFVFAFGKLLYVDHVIVCMVGGE